MFVVVEVDIYNADSFGSGSPCGAIGPFETREDANQALERLSIDHQDDSVEFVVLAVKSEF